MTPKKAIEILTRQRNKIFDKHHYNDEAWVFHIATYIKDFFGEDSPEHSFISQFNFKILVREHRASEDFPTAYNARKDMAKRFLDNCIQTIRDKGLYRPPRQNFLQRFNDTWLTALLTLVLSAIGTGAFLLGQYTSGVENIELKRELKQTQDSLRHITRTFNY